MGNYLNKEEKNKDYFNVDQMYKSLSEFIPMPSKLFGRVKNPLLAHIRMMYGHVDWEKYVMTLDQHTIDLIKKKNISEKEMRKLEHSLVPGVKVVILDDDDMKPASYISMIRNTEESNYIEVLPFDLAVDRAASHFVDTMVSDYDGYKWTAVYYTVAFRLAMMEGEMSDEERFSKENYDKVWRHVYSSFLYMVCWKLASESYEISKGKRKMSFDMNDYRSNYFMDAYKDKI